MAISVEELKHLAELARLRLSEEEFSAMQTDLNRVLDHFERLQALSLSETELTPHSVDSQSVWRDDKTRDCLSQSDALSGAPEVQAGLFLVPTIIE